MRDTSDSLRLQLTFCALSHDGVACHVSTGRRAGRGLQTPGKLVSQQMQEVLVVMGAPIMAWLVAALILLRWIVQRKYRQRFQEYVEEQRFRLLTKLSTLQRTLTKQEKLLEIQRQY